MSSRIDMGAGRDAGGDRNWEHYQNVILDLHTQSGIVTVDLRSPLTRTERERLVRLGPHATFGVVTACNPEGEQLTAVQNTSRDDHLRDVILHARLAHIRADGCSPDRSHCERGFAIWTDCNGVKDLACQFQQLAYFWFDGQSFWLIGALAAGKRVRLPSPDQ